MATTPLAKSIGSLGSGPTSRTPLGQMVARQVRMRASCCAIVKAAFGEDHPKEACYRNARTGLEMHSFYTVLYEKPSFEAVAKSSGHGGLVNLPLRHGGHAEFSIDKAE